MSENEFAEFLPSQKNINLLLVMVERQHGTQAEKYI